MNETKSAASPSPFEDPADFSLVLGGPLYQLFRRSHLAGDALQLLRRRIVALSLIAWLPLLVLSLAEEHFWRGSVELPFLLDAEVHVRFLIALPLLVAAELFVHQRMRRVVGQFEERGLVPDSAREQFHAAIRSAMRLRNSVAAEVLLIAFVYVVGVGFVWRTQIALDKPSWYGLIAHSRLDPSLAGWWFGCLSLPLFQFLLLRWYFRLFIWARFLWQVSRIDLRFVPTHPDRCGGLGFLSLVGHAFSPLLLAQGALLSGTIADQIFFAGKRLPDFELEIAGLVVVIVSVVLTPLLVFGPKLAAAKRAGLREYGVLSQRYVRDFDDKWLRGGAPPGEPFVGSADIQSLADLANSYDVMKEMRLAPFTLQTVVQLAVTVLVPLVPLLLTMISPKQLLEHMLKLVF